MMGLVFNLAQEVVEATFGPEVWDSIIESAGVEGAYTSLGSYPDADAEALVLAASETIGISTTDVLVMIGRRGFAPLIGRHPDLIAESATWDAVLAAVDGHIHPDMTKIYPEAEAPQLAVEGIGSREVRITYRSRRRWCAFAEGLVLGLGDWCDVALTVDHDACVLGGDDECILRVLAR